jgi:hypothetical protein
MLILYFSCCMLILQNTIQHVFNLFYPACQDAWALQVRPHGHQNIVPRWEKEVTSLAESILLCFIRSDKQLSNFLSCGMWDAINVGLLFFLVGSQNLWDP